MLVQGSRFWRKTFLKSVGLKIPTIYNAKSVYLNICMFVRRMDIVETIEGCPSGLFCDQIRKVCASCMQLCTEDNGVIPEQCCSTLYDCQKELLFYAKFCIYSLYKYWHIFQHFFKIGSSLITRRKVKERNKIFLVEAYTYFAASE